MQVLSNGRVRRTEAEWKEIVARWEKSGLKPRPFCRREQIQLSSFLRWQRKGQAGAPAAALSEEFVQVTVPVSKPSSDSSWVLEITLPNGCELRFRN